MSSGLRQVPTMSLSAIRGASSSLNVRGRLFEVTGPMKLSATSDHVYCRGVLADDSGSTMQITFWNLSEMLHAQIISHENMCVVITEVQSQVSREGYTDRSRHCLSFNGGCGSGSGKAKKEAPISKLAEIAENPAYPKVLPSVTPMDSPPPRAYSQPTRTTPTVSPNAQQSPQHTPQKRPRDLVHFTCLKCDRGDMPSCGADGEPHPSVCPVCGFLEAPVVPFCPTTGERHFNYT